MQIPNLQSPHDWWEINHFSIFLFCFLFLEILPFFLLGMCTIDENNPKIFEDSFQYLQYYLQSDSLFKATFVRCTYIQLFWCFSFQYISIVKKLWFYFIDRHVMQWCVSLYLFGITETVYFIHSCTLCLNLF